MPEEHQLLTTAPAESIPSMADQIAQLHSSLRDSCLSAAAGYETTQDRRALTVHELCTHCRGPH